MSTQAHKVREIRVPVSTPLQVAREVDPTYTQVEYVVLEQWSDFTMRHPTTGNVVAMELWRKAPAVALDFLRTGEREIHYIRTGEWKGNYILDAPNHWGYVRVSLQGAFPSGVPIGERFVLVLSAYFDESGTHRGSDAVSVAGYISTPEQWSVFEAEWQATLEPLNLPKEETLKRPYFHMTDFSASKIEPYSGWDYPQKRRVFAHLAAIINRHVIGSVGFTLLKSRFDTIMSPKAKRVVGGPYGLAATCCFIGVGEALDPAWPSAQVAYVYGAGAEGKGQVLKVFDNNYDRPAERQRMRLLSLKFEDAKKFAPLQAADIVAYEITKHLPRQLGVSPHAPRMQHMGPLSERRWKWAYLDDDQLSMWSRVLDHVDEETW